MTDMGISKREERDVKRFAKFGVFQCWVALI